MESEQHVLTECEKYNVENKALKAGNKENEPLTLQK